MLTKVLALELGEHGITVTSVAPGEIATPMTGKGEEEAYGEKRPGNRWAGSGTSTRWPR